MKTERQLIIKTIIYPVTPVTAAPAQGSVPSSDSDIAGTGEDLEVIQHEALSSGDNSSFQLSFSAFEIIVTGEL